MIAAGRVGVAASSLRAPSSVAGKDWGFARTRGPQPPAKINQALLYLVGNMAALRVRSKGCTSFAACACALQGTISAR